MREPSAVLALLAALATIGAGDFEVPIVLDMTGVPECIRACMSDLFYRAFELIHHQNPVSRVPELCRAYDNASMCVENQKDACIQTTIFEIALSGLDELCHEKEQVLEVHKPCLSEHLGMVLKSCDRSCEFTDILIDLSGRGNSARMQRLEESHDTQLEEISTICTIFACMTSCSSRNINVHCPPAGTLITEALLKPFFTAATIFEEIGTRAKLSIYRQIPSQCYYLTSLEAVHGIAHGVAPNQALARDPEEAITKEMALRERMRLQKKAQLERQFLMDAGQMRR